MSRNQIIAIKKAYLALVASGAVEQANALSLAFPDLALDDC